MPEGVATVLQRLDAAGAQSFVVGGAVRDLFLGRPLGDWDVATDLRPEQITELFTRVAPIGIEHGTVMVLTRTGPVEVTTFRGDGEYVDGRRPSRVVFHTDLEVDLGRRDFTVNAMAARRVVVDPFGGQVDLNRRLIRCVGDAKERFAEDGLRPLRALRFAATLGFFVEKATRAALPAALPTFAKVAWERKRIELFKLLCGVSLKPLFLLEESGMLEQLAPELFGVNARLVAMLEGAPPGWARLACWALARQVSPGGCRTILARLRAPKREQRMAENWLVANLDLGSKPPAGCELRRWLSRFGVEDAPAAALVARAWKGQRYLQFPTSVRQAIRVAPPLNVADLAINGRTVEDLGFAGKEVGLVLGSCLNFVLERPSRNRRRTLLEFAHRLSTGRSQQKNNTFFSPPIGFSDPRDPSLERDDDT
ncbi:MAG: hypothetical protein A2341_15735 [Deltaproteobacteria bacterium RIFOXYB12_FULL_58_9]|nr:MAG: hypothetical protein A2341_15735 [Deltaproteobacteria bacterium RIFOXYB12_FULL_58_9]